MSDDDEPRHPSSNPFIRFKDHVNTNIGAGISLLTGRNIVRGEAPASSQSGDPYNRTYHSEHFNPSSTDRRMHPFDRVRRRRESTEGFRYWDEWTQLDPYSPYNLRHLPQPIPSDLPRDVDASHFGFHEAFEDLMAVSGFEEGRLMDLRARADLKKSILNTFASGEPPLVWVRRLHRGGLLPPPFIWQNATSLGEIREQVVGQEEQHHHASVREWIDERRKASGSLFEEAERRSAEDIRALEEFAAKMFNDFGGKGLSWDEMMEKLDKDFIINPAGMIRKAEQTFKEIERYAGELASGTAHTRALDDTRPAQGDKQDQPSTEQDLFSMIRSAVAEADRTFNNFAKSITEIGAPPTNWQAERAESEKLPGNEVVEYDSYGGKKVTTTSEHTDAFGNIHHKTEIRQLNADGEEVGRQTHYSVHSANEESSQRDTREFYEYQLKPLEQQNRRRLASAREEDGEKLGAEKLQDDKKTESGNDNVKPSGWFWR
ncbi:hypothetical protein VPNG_00547 [Cytospora leucostoma]|uniref:Uncharacterized protein n=1 Tax=Cytospora leucostoma TaxID=1230097 RepID=A0A423XMV8_9PEZI|nr:hypothetical protein VPNG_00547 [Cytospora leucostoma]